MARTPPPETAPRVASGPSLAGPQHATLWASLVYCVSALLLAWPALAGQFLLNPRSDQYKAGYAFREFAAQSLRSGHGFPLWNPFIEGGLPYVAAMHGDIFYPTFLLRMIMPTDMAMTWEFPIHLVLCGLFTYLFLRAWRVGFYAALVGGLAYMMGGSIAGYAGPGHDGKLFVSTMLPLALLLLTRGIRDDRLWAWGALAITIGLAVLSPHPQLLQYLLLTAGAFALYVAFADHPGQGTLARSTAIKRLGMALGAVMLGMLIGAIQFGPALIEYKPWSPRAGGHDFAIATSYSFPIEETFNAYLPQFSGILDAYWGRNYIHFHSDYFGVVVLMLVGAAFGALAFKGFRRFWIGAGIVSLLWAFGGYTPFFNLILAVVPGTKYFRAPSTIIYVTAFAVSVLAALGMERLLARRVRVRYALGWVIAGLVIAVLLSVGGYDAISTGLVGTMSGSLPPQLLDRARSLAATNATAAILGAWRSLGVVALTAALIWAFLTDRLSPRIAATALAALLVLDLWSIERIYWVFSPRASTLYATDPAIDAIKADIARSGQIARVWTEDRFGGDINPRDPAFVGDALMSHDLRTLGNYHGNELDMYDKLVEYQQGQVLLSPAFWNHENVGYLYTGLADSSMAQFSEQLKVGAFTKLAGPVKDAAGSTVYAYKLPRTNTPAWVANTIVKAPADQALATVVDPRFEQARVAIVDTSATNIQGQQITTLPAPATTKATVTSNPPGAYDISLDQPATAGQALVVSDNYFPGWTATVNGVPAPVARTNYNLVGVALPAGARSVQLRFDDAAYEKGKVITLIAVIASVLLWGAGLLADRRRTPPAIPVT